MILCVSCRVQSGKAIFCALYCRFPCAPASILERNRTQLPANDPAVKIQGSTLFVLIKGDPFRARLGIARGSKKVHGRKIYKCVPAANPVSLPCEIAGSSAARLSLAYPFP